MGLGWGLTQILIFAPPLEDQESKNDERFVCEYDNF